MEEGPAGSFSELIPGPALFPYGGAGVNDDTGAHARGPENVVGGELLGVSSDTTEPERSGCDQESLALPVKLHLTGTIRSRGIMYQDISRRGRLTSMLSSGNIEAAVRANGDDVPWRRDPTSRNGR